MSGCGRIFATSAVLLGRSFSSRCFRAHFVRSEPGTLRKESDGHAGSSCRASLSPAVQVDFSVSSSLASRSPRFTLSTCPGSRQD